MRQRVLIGVSVIVLAAASGACGSAAGEEEARIGAVSQAEKGGSEGGNGSLNRGRTFFREGFPQTHDNGRSCATCHVPEEGFSLTQAHVEERYQEMLEHPEKDDPVFRSIDANDGASDYTNLRKGLIRVVITLPTYPNGLTKIFPVDDPNATSVAVWRSVPTVVNAAFTAPYQLDGRAGTLQIQALGALHAHSQIEREPFANHLDDVANYQSSLFSSPAVEAMSAALAAGQTPPATDPPLDELETQGKAAFQHHCATCHGGPTQTKPLPQMPPIARNVLISRPLPGAIADMTSQFPPSPVAASTRTWAFRAENGTVTRQVPSTDPGIALLTGQLADINSFDFPTLHGISKTAPYFHDNSAATLEEMLSHYQRAFKGIRRLVPPSVPYPARPDELPDSDIPGLLAYLRKI